MHARYLVAMALLLTVGCGREAAPASSKQQLENRLHELVGQRVVDAQRARNAIRAAFEAETVTLDLVTWAIDALWKAKMAAAEGPAQRIDAHVARVQDLGLLQEKIASLFEVGARGGEAEKYAQINYCVETAQIALVDECLASGQQYPQAAILPDRIPFAPADSDEVDQPIEP
jgi:hypothetical protein